MNNISSSINTINPYLLSKGGFNNIDQTLIPNYELEGSYDPGEDTMEFHVYDSNKETLHSDYSYTGWSVDGSNTSIKGKTNTNSIIVSPDYDLSRLGFDRGKLYGVYNFIKYKLGSSQDKKYYINEISSDRTEVSLKSNYINSKNIIPLVKTLKEELENIQSGSQVLKGLSPYFDEFYLNLGDNNYSIGINIDYVGNEDDGKVIVKLYQPLPSNYNVKDELNVVIKVGESKAYEVTFLSTDPSQRKNITYLQGPNTNLDFKAKQNPSTELKSENDLMETNSSASKFNLLKILKDEGVKITPNYSYGTFNEFVNFSSAKSRINNFYKKVSNIQGWEDQISLLTSTTSSSPTINSFYSRIENTIKNFDDFEYYQYYNSSSFSYPKTGSNYPYTLLNTGSTQVLTWMGNDIENHQYYGGYILSASLYDNKNQNWLYYTIPEFIRDNDDNNQYIEFSNMVGQHFDEVWMYTKALSERYNTTNNLDQGLPLGLIKDAIDSLGFTSVTSKNTDNFIGLIGENDGYYAPSTGSEFINDYIAVNVSGSTPNIIQSFPYALDKINKEILKRLYHNLSYLIKKKGTISGLRQLINVWGIPNTILRINEFGGKNKDNDNDYDDWYNRFSYAFKTNSNASYYTLITPWEETYSSFLKGERNVPSSIAFRFQTLGIPDESHFTQSLISNLNSSTSDGCGFGITLNYATQSLGNYQGTGSNPYGEYGTLNFVLGDNSGNFIESDDIYLPFFDKGWWSVLLKREGATTKGSANDITYTLYAKNKQYNGSDGNSLGFQASASFIITGSSDAGAQLYNTMFESTSSGAGVGLLLGGGKDGTQIKGTTKILNVSGVQFTGSFQELRYYTKPLNGNSFNSFVMNPESIEGNSVTGPESSFDMLAFRAPLGNELETKFTLPSGVSTTYYSSSHPSTYNEVPSLITGSFIYDGVVTSGYSLTSELTSSGDLSTSNVEVYFMNQPSSGVNNKISNKIQIKNNPYYGNLLSRETSIQQDYQVSRSYVEDTTMLEVGFSPQDEVNDDIIQSLGYNFISDTLEDPRFMTTGSVFYPQLRVIAKEYFKKYSKGNLQDYIRLIKYYDNSLFSSIKAYTPARTKVNTGIIIKQHLLERNRVHPTQFTINTKVATNSSSSMNESISFKNIEITASIPPTEIYSFTEGPGGVLNPYNNPSFNQSYTSSQHTPIGIIEKIEDTQKEFYNGEYEGTELHITTQSLFNNPYSSFKGEPIFYHTLITSSINYPSYSVDIHYYVSSDYTSALEIEELMTNNPPPETDAVILSLYLARTAPTYSLASIALWTKNKPETLDGRDNPTIPGWGDYLYPNEKKYPQNVRAPYFYFDLETGNVDPYLPGTPSSGKIASSLLGIPTDDKLWVQNTKQYRIFKYQKDRRLFRSSFSLVTPSGGFASKTLYLGSFKTQRDFHIKNIYNIGTASVNMYPLTYFNSGSDIAKWIPTSFIFNRLSLNGGDTINNINTLANNPTFQITLDYNGTPQSQGVYNLSGSIINNEYNLIESQGESTDDTNTYFQYNIDGRINSGSSDFSLTTTSNVLYNFSPILPSDFIFSNSDFNALLNNDERIRKSKHIQSIEYQSGMHLPSNLNLIKQNKASRVETPDSNYHQKSFTQPRYLGSKLKSVNYNYYTPRSSSISFINGDSGSWDGDVSYGNESVINSYPRYFAHFKSSYSNLALEGTYIFEIDTLIESPQEDINVTNFKINTPTLKTKGNSDFLQIVSSAFEKNRDSLILYDSNISSSINYSTLKEKKSKIFQGGIQYNIIGATTTGLYGPSPNNFPNSSPAMSFTTSSFQETYRFELSYTIGNTVYGPLLITSSNSFILGGSNIKVSQSLNITTGEVCSFYGPGLGLINSINTVLELNQPTTYSLGEGYILGFPINSSLSLSTSKGDYKNYHTFNFSSSSIAGYSTQLLPFIIKQNDEIQITYLPMGGSAKQPHITQEFIVTSVSSEDGVGSLYQYSGSSPTNPTNTIHSSSLFNKINVSPDPSTLNIANGEIDNIIIRRREEKDNRIIIYQTPPQGVLGNNNITGGGFIIPNDFSITQKNNIQGLIDILKEKNSFG